MSPLTHECTVFCSDCQPPPPPPLERLPHAITQPQIRIRQKMTEIGCRCGAGCPSGTVYCSRMHSTFRRPRSRRRACTPSCTRSAAGRWSAAAGNVPARCARSTAGLAVPRRRTRVLRRREGGKSTAARRAAAHAWIANKFGAELTRRATIERTQAGANGLLTRCAPPPPRCQSKAPPPMTGPASR